MRRSRSANTLLPLDPEIERTLYRLRREVYTRTGIEKELDIEVQPQPIEMAVNEERAVIEAERPSLANMTQAIVKPDPANSICTWDDLARKFLIKFFPTKKTKVLRSQILGFEQRAGETLRQAWERYKKMLRDCPHHCQMGEVLGHTFVDGLDDASKMNLDSACGGSCMSRPYSEIQILLNNFTANDNNWQNPQVNAVTLRNGRELEDVPKKKRDKPIPEAELIPKVTHKPKNDAKIPEPVEAPRPPPPFPQRLQKKNDDRMFTKFLSMLSQVQLNIPLIDVLCEIPKYAKYIKDVVAHKRRLTEFETVALTEECTSRVQNKLPQKLKDPGSFTIPVRIGNIDVGRALCNLGESINLMPLSMFKQLGLGPPRPTTVMLQLADRSIAHPEGVIEDVLL
ncbi:uncharacterized protein [Nicotiana sylvestris]|uniref:uncharacterized protein n=1 Tax=Nicotiana sylvestris TaxID=4096 RepID=UPI00388C72BC